MATVKNRYKMDSATQEKNQRSNQMKISLA